MAKKLLIVTQHYWPENFRITDIAEGFAADGIEVDVLCGLPNYPKGEWFDGYSEKGPFFEEHNGIKLYRCREIPRTGNSSVRIFLNYISWPWYARWALNRLPGGYDAVLCYNTSPVLMSWPAIHAAKKFHAPLTNYVMDIWPENLYSVLNIQNKLLRGIAQYVSDWHYSRADKLIALSPALESRLIERVGKKNRGLCRKADKLYTVIPQYCEDFYAVPACDATLKEKYKGCFTLLFAGNFSPAQSLETAITALALLRDKAAIQPGNAALNTVGADGTGSFRIRFVLVGDGMSREALEQLVRENNLQDVVCFYGSVSPQQVPALSGAADALLVSLSDSPDLGMTIPAKLASCMACRKPLLVSINGAGAAAAEESSGALVSPACDANTLADHLEQLAASDAGILKRMGDASFSYYETHYRRAELLARLEEFLF